MRNNGGTETPARKRRRGSRAEIAQLRTVRADVGDVPFAEHLIAHTRGFGANLLDASSYAWLWRALQRAIPDAFSCVLMPDHIHLVAPPGNCLRFNYVLRAFSARFGVRFDTLAEVANSAASAARMMRYGYFNPVHAGYVPDPFWWPWSTLRDLIGAVHPCWRTLDDIARCLRRTDSGTLKLLSQTADYRPTAPRREGLETASREALLRAVAAARRLPCDDVLSDRLARRLLVQAHLEVRRVTRTMVAQDLGLSRRTVVRLQQPRDPGIEAVLLCLSDARLRVSALEHLPPGSGRILSRK